MSNSVIDSVTQSSNFRLEQVTTNLQLALMPPGSPAAFGMYYSAQYSGLKKGTVNGGPVSVPGNGTWVANEDPKVIVIVSNFSNQDSHVSMYVEITVKMPMLGTKTIFNAVLQGEYGANNLQEIVQHISSLESH